MTVEEVEDDVGRKDEVADNVELLREVDLERSLYLQVERGLTSVRGASE